jgi:hypothetical protein
MAYCINCGYALKPDSSFCEGCGSRLKVAVAPTPTTPANLINQSKGASGMTAVSGDERPRNAARIAAIVALVGFLLPWVSCQGLTGPQTITGVELASRGASGLWVIPVSMLIALAILLNKGKTLQERATAAKVVTGSGVAGVLALLYYWAAFNGAGQQDEFGLGAAMRQAFTIEIGAILSAVGAVGAALSGYFLLQSASHTRTQAAGQTEITSGGGSDPARSSLSIRNQGE